MKYLIGGVLIYLVYNSRTIDPFSKLGLYAVIAGVVYYLV
jgi:hypothetical protein